MPVHESSLPVPARILEVVHEADQVKRFVLDADVDAAPGQYVMAWLPGVDERPFSLANSRPLTLTIAAVGPLTSRLHGLTVGDWIWWRGPLGRGFHLPKPMPDANVLLVGGGYGAGPLSFLAARAVEAGWQVSSVIGARSEAQVVSRQALGDLSKGLWTCTEDGSCGERGLVTEVADRLLGKELAGKVQLVCGCGPHGMLDALRELCLRHGLPCQLSYEAIIKCGLGICGSCAWNGLLVCRDGPVFEWSASGQLLP